MPILAVDNLEKYYGIKPIIHELSFQMDLGDKVGLVGRNGSGKTTLLQLLSGRLERDGGTITVAKDTTIGYLTQELEFYPEKTVYQELRGLYAHVDKIQDELRQIEKMMAECRPEDDEQLSELLASYAQLQEKFEENGGFRIESEIQGVLQGLGLPKQLWDQSPSSFSGGERTRVALARLLLFKPNLLLLDEPTNYLDINAVKWLEEYLKNYSGSLLLVSHDRYFLDRVVNKVLALYGGKVEVFKGNYSRYRELWSERRRHEMEAYLQQQKEISKKERFIRESRATEKSKRQAKSIEKRLQHIDRLDRPREDKTLRGLNLAAEGRTSDTVLSVTDLGKSYEERRLFSGLNFDIHSGEHVVLMGPNGIGKTTLFRLLIGDELPDSGEIKWGHGVRLGYFSQMLKESDLSGSAYEQIMQTGELSSTEARNFLGAFLFHGDDVFLPVSELSGGEQRRLALAKLVLSSANLLFMDEPTNHLDLPSLDVLEDVLTDYLGSLFVITHDRFLAQRLANRLLWMDEGEVHEFESYEVFEQWMAHRDEQRIEDKRAKRRHDDQRRVENSSKMMSRIRRMRKEIQELEVELERLEEEKNKILEALNQPDIFSDFEASRIWGNKLHETERLINEVFDQWAELTQDLVQIEAD